MTNTDGCPAKCACSLHAVTVDLRSTTRGDVGADGRVHDPGLRHRPQFVLTGEGDAAVHVSWGRPGSGIAYPTSAAESTPRLATVGGRSESTGAAIVFNTERAALGAIDTRAATAVLCAVSGVNPRTIGAVSLRVLLAGRQGASRTRQRMRRRRVSVPWCRSGFGKRLYARSIPR